MLRRSSIRAKLIATLVPLVAIFCVLVASGLWGLYRYGRLADALTQRAAEIPFAHKLNDLANSLHNLYSGDDELHDQGMLESDALTKKQRRNQITNTLIDLFELALERYEDEISRRSLEATRLSDEEQLQASLDQIRESFDECQKPTFAIGAREPQLKSQFDALVRRTQRHVDLMHAGVQNFSDNVLAQYTKSIKIAWFCGGFALLMTGILCWVFRSHVAQPFRTLLDGSRLVAAGQFGHRIDLGTQDELSELAQAMNGMSERFMDVVEKQKAMNAELDKQVKERTREVIQNEQLASVGFLAAGVAHEINNPLASIAWSAESSERHIVSLAMAGESGLDVKALEAMKTNLRRIQEEAYRCSGITKRLLDFSRLGDVSRCSTDMGELVEDVVSIIRDMGKYKCKTIDTHCDDRVFAHVNSHEMRQVVLNLVTNALESVDTDGAVSVLVRQRGPVACVRVEDNGCGMSQEVLEHLFEPFFTRRREGTGTGLGLSITYRIVSQHHGSLTAHSDGEGRGSRLEMLLPIKACRDDEIDQQQNNLGWNDDSQKAA